jgi:3-methyladenine DNA glycosylase Tag
VKDFKEIEALASKRKGGKAALEKILAETRPLDSATIAATPADRILAAMTKRIFCAGFSSTVVDRKWEAFEVAFGRFDPLRCAALSDEHFNQLVRNPSIVRNRAKILSIPINATLLLNLAQSHESAAEFFAKWPDIDYVGLLNFLKKRGSRLGGETGMHFLRSIGKPAFVTSPDVVAALMREGVVDHVPGSRGDFAVIQQAFNRWSNQSGRNLTDVSRILAMSVDPTSESTRKH